MDAAHVCVKENLAQVQSLRTDLMYDGPCDGLADAMEPLMTYLPR